MRFLTTSIFICLWFRYQFILELKKIQETFLFRPLISGTKHFPHFEYKRGIKWIQDYIDITLQAAENKVYEIEVYHKPFTTNSELLIELLNNPHEMQVEDKVSCVLVPKSQELM